MAEVFFCHFFMNDLPISKLDPKHYKALVFDLDGTLYDLQKMQGIMRRKIIQFLLNHPRRWKEIQAVYHFRKHRKKERGRYVKNLAEAQYNWVTESTGIPQEEVKRYISTWMYELPLPFLQQLIYPGVEEFIELLDQKDIPWAIFSDLEAQDKMEALGFPQASVYAAPDPEIDALKPKPVGLIKIAQDLGIESNDLLFIGDQEELDGYCAKQVHCDFVLIKPQFAAEQYAELLTIFR